MSKCRRVFRMFLIRTAYSSTYRLRRISRWALDAICLPAWGSRVSNEVRHVYKVGRTYGFVTNESGNSPARQRKYRNVVRSGSAPLCLCSPATRARRWPVHSNARKTICKIAESPDQSVCSNAAGFVRQRAARRENAPRSSAFCLTSP